MISRRRIDSAADGVSAVACATSRTCVVVDADGGIVVFDPRAPRVEHRVAFGSVSFTAVSCPSSRQCSALEAVGGALTFDPRSPQRATHARGDSAKATEVAVACPTSSRCVAVDDAGGEVTFDPHRGVAGRRVVIERRDDPAAGLLAAVACPTRRLCVAVGWHWQRSGLPSGHNRPRGPAKTRLGRGAGRSRVPVPDGAQRWTVALRARSRLTQLVGATQRRP